MPGVCRRADGLHGRLADVPVQPEGRRATVDLQRDHELSPDSRCDDVPGSVGRCNSCRNGLARIQDRFDRRSGGARLRRVGPARHGAAELREQEHAGEAAQGSILAGGPVAAGALRHADGGSVFAVHDQW